MSKGIIVNFSKNIIHPGDIVVAEASYDGVYKKTPINAANYATTIKLLNFEGAETPINFSSHFDEEVFNEIRYIEVKNEIFESEKTILIGDNIYSELKNTIFEFAIEPISYIYKNNEKIAKLEIQYDGLPINDVLFKCSTSEEKKVYQLQMKFTILKKDYVNETVSGKVEPYNGVDNKIVFTLNDIDKIQKVWLEVK